MGPNKVVVVKKDREFHGGQGVDANDYWDSSWGMTKHHGIFRRSQAAVVFTELKTVSLSQGRIETRSITSQLT